MFARKGTPITSSNINRIYLMGFAVVAIFLFAYITGQWHPNMDGRITEMNICNSNTDLSYSTKFSTSIKQIYFCGKVEGTTFTRATFRLWCNEKYVYGQSQKLDVGQFFIPIPHFGNNNTYEKSDCRATVQYDRIVVHEIAFSIAEP